MGISGEGPTVEAEVAAFATKGPDEDHSQNSSFEGASMARLINSFTLPERAIHHCVSPDAASACKLSSHFASGENLIHVPF